MRKSLPFKAYAEDYSVQISEANSGSVFLPAVVVGNLKVRSEESEVKVASSPWSKTKVAGSIEVGSSSLVQEGDQATVVSALTSTTISSLAWDTTPIAGDVLMLYYFSGDGFEDTLTSGAFETFIENGATTKRRCYGELLTVASYDAATKTVTTVEPLTRLYQVSKTGDTTSLKVFNVTSVALKDFTLRDVEIQLPAYGYVDQGFQQSIALKCTQVMGLTLDGVKTKGAAGSSVDIERCRNVLVQNCQVEMQPYHRVGGLLYGFNIHMTHHATIQDHMIVVARYGARDLAAKLRQPKTSELSPKKRTTHQKSVQISRFSCIVKEPRCQKPISLPPMYQLQACCLPPPLTAYCFRALKCRSGATPRVRLRWLNEKGFALSEINLVITDSWTTITNRAGTIPSGAVAAEVIQVTDGYVFYHTGADPANVANVAASMDTDSESPLSTLLTAGNVLGQASYIRPMDSQIGRSSHLTRPINQLFTSGNIEPDTYTYSEGGTAQLLEFPARFSRVILDLGLAADPEVGLDVVASVKMRFRLIDYDKNTDYADSRVGQWTEYITLVNSLTVVPGTNFRRSYEYSAPNVGLHNCELELTFTGGKLIGQSSPVVSFLQLFHEVYI